MVFFNNDAGGRISSNISATIPVVPLCGWRAVQQVAMGFTLNEIIYLWIKQLQKCVPWQYGKLLRFPEMGLVK
jgi:hypothetical protein